MKLIYTYSSSGSLMIFVCFKYLNTDLNVCKCNNNNKSTSSNTGLHFISRLIIILVAMAAFSFNTVILKQQYTVAIPGGIYKIFQYQQSSTSSSRPGILKLQLYYSHSPPIQKYYLLEKTMHTLLANSLLSYSQFNQIIKIYRQAVILNINIIFLLPKQAQLSLSIDSIIMIM